MKKLILLLFIFFQTTGLNANNAFDPIYSSLLLNGSTHDVATAARAIRDQADFNQGLADQAAYALWKIAKGEINLIENDSWVVGELVKVLQKDKTGRYQQLLKSVRPKISNQFDIGPAGEIDQALNDITEDASQPFQVDLNHIASMKMLNNKEFTNAAQQRNSSNFYKVVAGEHFNKLLASLGLPDQVKGLASRRGNARKQGSIKMEFQYNNLIRLGLINELDTRVGWYVYEVEYLAGDLKSNPLDKLSMVEKIQSAHATLLREIARGLFDSKKFDKTTMDAAMERVFKESHTRDTQMEDAAAWLCKYVGHSKDKSYLPKFQQLSKTTSNRKLKRYAVQSIRLMEQADEGYF